MLIITRKNGQKIMINDDIEITVVESRNGTCKIYREEIYVGRISTCPFIKGISLTAQSARIESIVLKTCSALSNWPSRIRQYPYSRILPFSLKILAALFVIIEPIADRYCYWYENTRIYEWIHKNDKHKY